MTALQRLCLGVAAAAIALVATGAGFFWERGPDPVIYPPQQIPIYMPHDLHVREADDAKGIKGAGLDCDYCHEAITKSEKSSDRNIPGHEECEDCHSEWIEEDGEMAKPRDCARCHTDIDPGLTRTTTIAKPMVIPPPNIRFSHLGHLSFDLKCVECHSNVPNKTVATRDDFPTMDRCLDCHAKMKGPTDCIDCHRVGVGRQVATQYPSGVLKPARYHSFAIHDADFLRDHAVPAQKNSAYCANCHGPQYCLQCHDGLARNLKYHPADWISTHYIRGRKDDYRCQSCHRVQTFCINCHIRSGVASVATTQGVQTRRTIRTAPITDTNGMITGRVAVGPHPMAADGWLTRGSRNFHGFHAQRNIRSCASCHQEQFCIQCHGSRRGGVPNGERFINPHGPNAARLRGSTAARRNARVCLKCHNPNDPNWR